MRNAAIIIAAAMAVAPATAAVQSGPEGSLSGLIGANDYPLEALRFGHQGTVRMLLSVGTDGQVMDCRVLGSSQSASLDATSCEIMVKRARYKPALDADGRPVLSTVEQRITWRIDGNSPELQARIARLHWSDCVMREAGVLARAGGTSARKVADAALRACREHEYKFRQQMSRSILYHDPSGVVRHARGQFKSAVARLVDRAARP